MDEPGRIFTDPKTGKEYRIELDPATMLPDLLVEIKGRKAKRA